MKATYKVYILFIVLFVFISSGVSQQKSDKFDIGKMWTFEHLPSDYLKQTYNFNPSEDWLNDVKLSALRFGNGCSASFISEDGLVMTNHHCGRSYVSQVTRDGEDFTKTGFYAEYLADERPVPGLWVDQLINTIDVTKEIQDAMESGYDDISISKAKNDKIKELENQYSKESGLKCNVITFYNGGMYMMYCYKRYNDVRLVFSPENDIAHFGGDPDNFTYPRYSFDVAYFRVYENDKPYKTRNFFQWSKNGASVGEPLFVIGNPGSTERLKTISQLEFARDYQIPARVEALNFMVKFLEYFIKNNPDKKSRNLNSLYSVMNAQKVYIGQLKALNDNLMIERKADFENIIKDKVTSDPLLNEKYAHIWMDITEGINNYEKIFNELMGYEGGWRYSSKYFSLPRTIIKNIMQGKSTSDSLIRANLENVDYDYEKGLLDFDINILRNKMLSGNEYYQTAFGSMNEKEIKEKVLETSIISSIDDAIRLSKMTRQELMEFSDPLILFYATSFDRYNELVELQKQYQAKIDVNAQKLGRVIFDIYGNSIPPDATLTLRISDGEIKTYQYNGTLAQPFTTFHGLYDRYIGSGKNAPWDLPDRWKNPPPDFNLNTQYNLITTNDIIGGNSGSALINTNAEVVGLVFDGNIESLPGRYIYTTESNRTVAVDSRGLMEAITNLYKAKRLSDEIESGRIK